MVEVAFPVLRGRDDLGHCVFGRCVMLRAPRGGMMGMCAVSAESKDGGLERGGRARLETEEE